MKHYTITHKTSYHFERSAEYSIHQAYLTPAQDVCQSTTTWKVEASPSTSHRTQIDGSGNTVDVFTTVGPHDSFVITAYGKVAVKEKAALLASPLHPDDERSYLAQATHQIQLMTYLRPDGLCVVTPAIQEWVAPLRSLRKGGIWPAALELLHKVNAEIAFSPGFTLTTTPAQDVLKMKRGVCQDFAHLYSAAARALEIPVGYVSGYVHPPEDQATAVASHAWIEVFVPGAGWIGLDPTEGKPVGDRYVKLAMGRDYLDVAPVKGFRRGGGLGKLSVEVSVNPDAPKSNPYLSAMVQQ